MFHYDVVCSSCRRTFKAQEGTEMYKQLKVSKNKSFVCEDCDHKIRLEAILHLMRGNSR